MIYALFPHTTHDLIRTAEAIKAAGHDIATFGFDEGIVKARIASKSIAGEAEAKAFFESRGIHAMHAYLEKGELITQPLLALKKATAPSRYLAALFPFSTSYERLNATLDALDAQGFRAVLFGYPRAHDHRAIELQKPEIKTEARALRWLDHRGLIGQVYHMGRNGALHNRQLKGEEINHVGSRFVGSMKVDAVVAAAGGDLLHEIENFLCGVRMNHAEPVFLFCDAAGAKEAARVVAKYGFTGVEIHEGVNAAFLDTAESRGEAVTRHAARFSIGWIHAKIEACRYAMKRLPEGSGVLLLDTDITLARPVSGSWRADLVLSPHYVVHPERQAQRFAGYWNAGMILMRGEGFVDTWEKYYFAGVGGFYEQKCLERLSVEFTTEQFPLEHNVGVWREEDIGTSERDVSSFHFHPDQAAHNDQQESVKERALAAMSNARRACELPFTKIAFVHLAKNAGSYTTERIESELGTKGFQILNSWVEPSLGREWDEGELYRIARGELWGQSRNPRYYTRAHQWSFSERVIDEMKARGWFTFSFLRDPKDVLCSCYFFDQKYINEGGKVWKNEGRNAERLHAAKNLEEALTALIEEPELVEYWRAPEWLEKVDFLRPFSDRSLKELFALIGVEYVPRARINKSTNKSFAHYVKSGEISKGLAARIEVHPEVQRINRLIDTAH